MSPPPRSWQPPPTTGRLLRHGGVAAAAAAAGLLGTALPMWPPYVGAFCPAAGLALVVLWRDGAACIPALFAGLLLAWSVAGAPFTLALALAAGDVGGPWLAAHALRQMRLRPALGQRRDIWQWLVAGVAGGPLVSAANGAAWLALIGPLSPLDLPAAAGLWWTGHALGVLLTGVPLLVLRRQDLRHALDPLCRARTLGVAVAGLGALLLAALLPPALRGAWLGLLAVPPLMLCWQALRDGLGLASSGLLALGVGLALTTAGGVGPFVAPPAPSLPGTDGLVPGAPMAMALWCWLAGSGALLLLVHAQTHELARRESRWRLALVGSDTGVAEWHLGGGDSWQSPRWRAMLDDTDGHLSATLTGWLDGVHADDRTPLLDAIDTLSADAPAHRRELRLRVGQDWRWFALRLAVAESDRHGAPLRIVATLDDVGARRQADEREQLSASVLRHLNEGVVVTDAEFRVLDANPTYCRISGQSLYELVGKVPAMLRPGRADLPPGGGAAAPAIRAALRSGGGWSGEVVERRRSGEACTLHVTVSTVDDPGGTHRRHVLVVSDVTEQRVQRERLERQAHFDELTRLPNRARLARLMADAMAATDRDGYLLAVCYLDLDRFKDVNERLGHEAGDRLLAELADRLRSALRGRGTDWADTAARLGGDEFVLLLRATTVEDARGAVERVLRLVGQPVTLADGAPSEIVTASIGATVYPLDASDADTLLRHADHAMYFAKQSGRNGYLFFDPEHSRRTEERVLAVGRVQEALDRGELLLYYQPKVDLKRGTVTGVEALLRWNHPERGLVPPIQFLPLIEHTGLSASIGDHVLALALDQLERWQAQGLSLSVSVNISARHLQAPDFAQRLAELLARHAQPLGPMLELEVLETAALTDIGFTSALLERCAALGVRWALDDFGTGYSTLTYLKRLPVQVLKIDRSFVRNMLTDAQDRAIVEGLVSLSHTFGCTAVAEGVETAAQARMLLEMGCEIGQGAGIASPMPAEAVAGWVREWKGLFALSAAPAGSLAGETAAPPDGDTVAPPDGGAGGGSALG